MTMIKLTVCLFISFTLVTGLDEGNNVTAIESPTTSNTPSITPSSPSNPGEPLVVEVPKYLFKLSALIDDSKVPTYLTNLILNQPSNLNITSEDILSLYGIKNITLEEFTRVLTGLNISSSSVFCLAGFEGFVNELQLDFGQIYSNIVKQFGVEPQHQLTFLELLDIDAFAFSFSLQFGDSYAEFKKGNLSNEAFVNAINAINKTSEEVFDGILIQVINGVVTKTPEEILEILSKYGFDRNKLSKLWNILNIDISRPYQLAVFCNLFKRTVSEIDSFSPLGILTSNNQITTTKEAVELFQGKPVKINTQYLEDDSFWPVSSIQNASVIDMMVLTLGSPVNSIKTFAVLATITEELQNCVFFSVDSNRTVIYELVSKVENEGNLLKINSTIFSSNVPMGSPLVCFNKVYGLAQEASSGVVSLRAFAMRNGSTVNPGGIIPDTVHEFSSSSFSGSSLLLVIVLSLTRYLLV